MPIEDIQEVCFVGAGNMGCFNAIKAALSGYRVRLYDVNEETLRQAVSRCEGIAAFLVGNGYCAEGDVPKALARITAVSELAAATRNANLVSESVFERLDIKREVHRQLDQVCPANTIVTTNSSYLLLSEIEDVVQRGDRFAALHSYMGSPLVDIVGSARTSAATIEILERYVQSLDAVPLVLKKEYPGYVLNAVLGPVLATAMMLVADGVASAEAVDRAWMINRSAPMGPLGILDLIGLGLVCDRWEHRQDEGSIPGLRPRVLTLLKPMVERNELGMATGRGFYQYPEPAYAQPGFLESAEADALYEALQLALVASAILVAAADVAEPADIDKAWMVGTSLDKGPFAILGDIGPRAFLEGLQAHVAAGRFDPDKARIITKYMARVTEYGQGLPT